MTLASARLMLLVSVLVTAYATGASAADPSPAPPRARPLFRDFMGVCGHTVNFRPELYRPTCRLVRDYHSLHWDVGDDTAFKPQFPFARNRVDWSAVYGSWKAAGFETDVSIQFNHTPPDGWVDLPRDARAYGRAFGAYFGPGGKALVASVEVGNEPGLYDDARYRTLFENMAGGLREGDPKLMILPANMTVEPSGRYTKNVECLRGLEGLYDALRTQTYAQVEGWPTWRRTYPEDPDPRNRYLANVRDLLAWRDKNAPGKPVWVTEFGWDASTKPAPAEGDFKHWVGSTEAEQARYLVRSFFLFAATGVERAYVFFFNDDDQPSVHASSGLTRNFVPKPAYWAVAHLYATLGDYRFERVVTETAGGACVYEFRHGGGADAAAAPAKRVWAAWLASGSDRRAEHVIDLGGGATVARAERMPMAEGKAERVTWEAAGAGKVRVTLGESPVYLWER
jgi:serine/threonine-protein kinase ATR